MVRSVWFFLKFIIKPIEIGFPITGINAHHQGQFFDLHRYGFFVVGLIGLKYIYIYIYIKKNWAFQPNIYTLTCSRLQADTHLTYLANCQITIYFQKNITLNCSLPWYLIIVASS